LPKGKKKGHSWREYLEGTYKPENRNNEDQIRSNVRIAAGRAMQDLKLILEKASSNDLNMIFFEDEEKWREMFSITTKLFAKVGEFTPWEKEQMRKAGRLPDDIRFLTLYLKNKGVKCVPWKPLKDENYRKRKVKELKNEKIENFIETLHHSTTTNRQAAKTR
jgi:hypothetical protein